MPMRGACRTAHVTSRRVEYVEREITPHASGSARTSSIVSASRASSRPVTLHAREPQRPPPDSACLPGRRRTRSRRRVGPNVHDVTVRVPVSRPSRGSVCQASISSVIPLNVFSEHDKRAFRVAGAEVEVRSFPAGGRAPLRREDDEVERVRRFDLQPGRRRAAQPRMARRATSPSQPHGRGRASVEGLLGDGGIVVLHARDDEVVREGCRERPHSSARGCVGETWPWRCRQMKKRR